MICYFYIFSSRRRHTRYIGDWSSDVCSSDLKVRGWWILAATILASSMAFIDGTVVNVALPALQTNLNATAVDVQWVRSEERRVGKECKLRWEPCVTIKKEA